MKLLLKRLHKTDKSTIGELSIDGVFQCYTLEDIERPVKIAGKTAIATGTYEVIINMSNRFQKLMPLLLKVPNFEGIRIHTGNKAEDTEGCILVGKTRSLDFVGNSRLVYKALFRKMQAAKDKITITIE
jgi:hypothetical protein